MFVRNVNVETKYDFETKEVKEFISIEGTSECECEKFIATNCVGNYLNLVGYCCDCEEEENTIKEPQYGGSFIVDGEEIYIKEMIYDKPNVIALWSDGTRTRCTCCEEDEWNPEMALLMCVMKKTLCNTEHIGKLLEDWAITKDIDSYKITLKDVRKRKKDLLEAEKFAKCVERAKDKNNNDGDVKEKRKKI